MAKGSTSYSFEQEGISKGSERDAMIQSFQTRIREKLGAQLTHYFTPSNLIRDKWLLRQFEEGNGWINLTVLAGNFAHIRALGQVFSLSRDFHPVRVQ